MELEEAKQLYADVEAVLSPYCEKMAVAGSTRRQRAFVNDVDIVAIPKMGTLRGILPMLFDTVKLNGPKMARLRYKGAQIDVYYTSPETWGIILLVRTGSANHNMSLASRAKSMGLHFSAARGIEDEEGKVIARRTEEEVFKALSLTYREPWERE